eukprot:CAMPEP_0114660030 /NCGR_PEP_ID=MMETSP0191-20121206/19122_1 /TAXON_ID=126664 /ORGANISM="Sorites sp." /LENGTH=300 /DNA_ID=CAMNT_0001887209 /DNA_START=54 /DNA_END=956 /DNA_ORIENTATION=+
MWALLLLTSAAQSTTVPPQVALEEVQHEYEKALKQGNETLKELQKWLEGIEASAAKQDEADNVASKIQHEAEEDFSDQKESMLSDFEKKLGDLSKATDPYMAAEELKKLSKDIVKLAKKQAKEMKKKYYSLRSEEKDKAQDMMQAIQKDAHMAMKTARKVEHFGRKVGQPEAEYEGNIGKAEKTTEGLSGRAEKYGEKAEHVVEHFFEKVEDKVEDRGHQVEKEAKAKAQERATKIHEAMEKAQSSSGPVAFFLRGANRGPLDPEALLSLLLPATGFAMLGLAFAWGRRTPSLNMPPSLG